METILNYLDNMFINIPQTPEVLRAKEDLAEIMEDKYNELIEEGRMQNEAIGIVISEFGNIQELIDELGIQKEDFQRENFQREDFQREDFQKEDFQREDFQKEDFQKEVFQKEGFQKEGFQKEGFQKEGFQKEDFQKEDFRKGGSQGEDFRKEDFIKDSKERDFTKNYKKDEKHGTAGYETKMRYVSALEADEYLFAVRQAAGKIASGVFLCICSPVMLMLLGGVQNFILPISDGIVVGVGITVLLCMVACAVGLLITASMKLESYEYLKKECFRLDPEYAQTIYSMWGMKKSKLAFKMITGVILCILSVIPVIVSSIIIVESNGNEFPIILSVVCLMVIVGIAVTMFITGGMEEESYKVILQEKEFSVRKKSRKKAEDIIAAIYWPMIVIVYFAWSFSTGSWGITWIIWPFAGILYDVVCKIIESSIQEK